MQQKLVQDKTLRKIHSSHSVNKCARVCARNVILCLNLVIQFFYITIIIRVFCQKGKFFSANSGTKATVLPKGRSFTANSGIKAGVLTKGRSSTANSGTKVAVLLGTNRYTSFLLLSATHCLFSIWTDLKRSEKISGAPSWRWGEWIWLTGPSGLHRNSPQGLNIISIRVFDQNRDPEFTITFRPHVHIFDH